MKYSSLRKRILENHGTSKVGNTAKEASVSFLLVIIIMDSANLLLSKVCAKNSKTFFRKTLSFYSKLLLFLPITLNPSYSQSSFIVLNVKLANNNLLCGKKSLLFS